MFDKYMTTNNCGCYIALVIGTVDSSRSQNPERLWEASGSLRPKCGLLWRSAALKSMHNGRKMLGLLADRRMHGAPKRMVGIGKKDLMNQDMRNV